jgi:hypothetical protein
MFLSYIYLRNKIKNYAEKFIGLTEKAGNSGFNDPFIEEKMEKFGWKSGQPWCAYFVKLIWLDVFEGTKDYNIINDIITGSTQETWANAINDKTDTVKVIRNKKPKVGDIAIWQKYSGGRPSNYGHAAIVTGKNNNEFVTVEGNTTDNIKNTREGYIVYRKKHTYNYDENHGLRLKGFIRYNYLNIF